MRFRKTSAYDASVVDKVVQAVVAEDRLEHLRDCPHAVEVGDFQLYDMQGPLRDALKPAQSGCFLGRSARCDDEVAR